jgi:murein DD-endopeptidase MepM/ murein hydrolase activator NlpD
MSNLGRTAARAAANAAIRAVLLKLGLPVGLIALVLLGVLFLIFLVMFVGALMAMQAEEANATPSGAGATGQTCTVVNETEGRNEDGLNVANIPAEYVSYVQEAADISGLPAAIIAAQIQAESGWNPQAGSAAGAQGIAQFLPETFASFSDPGDDIWNPADAIPALGRYMEHLVDVVGPIAEDRGEDPVRLALAGYNAGEGAVQQYKGIPPYPETENYVQKIMAGSQTTFSANCQDQSAQGKFIGNLGEGEWSHPLPGAQLTSGYGARDLDGDGASSRWDESHVGLDFSTTTAAIGGTAVAPTDMEITVATEWNGSDTFGSKVMGRSIDGGPEFLFGFYHLARGSIMVDVGDKVAAGEPLAIEGCTGNCRGTHLHFEIFAPGQGGEPYPYQNETLDPEPILRQKGVL